MKNILYLFLIISYFSYGQNAKSKGQHSTIDVKGNSNFIRVFQVNNIKEYNLNDEKQCKSFVEYLKSVPNINANLKEILSYSRETNDLVKRLAEKNKEDGMFNYKSFFNELEEKIVENTKLKIEIQTLRNQTKDEDLFKILEKANKQLEVYNSEGYQKILEEYKQKKKSKFENEKREIAQIAYLQSKNNASILQYSEALKQVEESLYYFPENADYLFVKGSILQDMFDVDNSIIIFQKILNLYIDDTLRASIYSNLLFSYKIQSNYEKALEYGFKTLQIDQKMFGENHSTISGSYNNIATIYHDISDYEKAIEYYIKSLNIHMQLLDKDLHTIVTIENNLGLVYQDVGRYDLALKYYKEAILICEKNQSDKPLLATSYSNIATLYREISQFEKALQYNEKALIIREKYFGKRHIETAISYNLLGVLYRIKGDFKRAIEYTNLYLEISELFFGKQSTFVASALNNLALIYRLNGSLEKSFDYCQKAIAIQDIKLPENHPDKATSFRNLALIYDKWGKLNKAIEYFKKSLIIDEEKLIANHRNIINNYEDLGIVYLKKGDTEKGMEYLNLTGFFNRPPFEIAKIMNSLGTQEYRSDRYNSSIYLYNISINYLKKSKSSETNTLLTAVTENLANSYCNNGDKNRALSFFKQAIELGKKLKDGKDDLQRISNNYEACKAK
jgi:tetratricopeptide (TPR) repeat protein